MAGYRTWTDREPLTAPDLNNYLMGQSVPRFPDATNRDAAMGGVVAGQLCYLVSTDAYYRVSKAGTWVIFAPVAGRATLAGLSTVVPCPVVTDRSVITVTAQTLAGVSTPSSLAVSGRSPGTSFTVAASQSDDRSVIGWTVTEPS